MVCVQCVQVISMLRAYEYFCDITRVQKESPKEFRVPASWNKEGTGCRDSKQSLFRNGELEHLNDPKVQNAWDSTSHFFDRFIHFQYVLSEHAPSVTTCLLSICLHPGVCVPILQ